jgi:hypothetical protein
VESKKIEKKHGKMPSQTMPIAGLRRNWHPIKQSALQLSAPFHTGKFIRNQPVVNHPTMSRN